MIRIGVVNIDVSHPKAFAEYLETGDRARYTAVYNDGFRPDTEVDAFMRRFGVARRFTDLDEMTRSIDVAFIQGVDWDRHLELASPFVAAGIPVFIDKPIVGNERSCREIERLVHDGATIVGGSSVRYAREIEEYRGVATSERGEILSVYGTAGLDEFNYAVHVVEGIAGLMPESRAIAARFVGRASIGTSVCETFAIRFADQRCATYTTLQGTWLPFHFVVTTTTRVAHIEIDNARLYGRLLDRICDVVEGRPARLAPIESLTESVRVLLAAKVSRDDPSRRGEEIALNELDETDTGYDGASFAAGYAAAAGPVYL